MVMEVFSADLWMANLQEAPDSLESWLDGVEARLTDAAARGASLLVMPEFACAQWLAFAPEGATGSASLGWMGELAPVALDRLSAMVVNTGVALLPGTMPFSIPEATGAIRGHTNRAWFLTPDGARQYQDKLSLTPLEADGSAGVTLPGTSINVMQWNGLRCAIAVCLDAEYTALWDRLGQLDLDLVMIPAKTDMITGYNRVMGCARVRAIELQTVVCCVGAVGAPLTPVAEDTGVGGAGVFLPCDVSVSEDGVLALSEPRAASDRTDPVLKTEAVPVGQCRRIRTGAAEAELQPALWGADHLAIIDPAIVAAA